MNCIKIDENDEPIQPNELDRFIAVVRLIQLVADNRIGCRRIPHNVDFERCECGGIYVARSLNDRCVMFGEDFLAFGAGADSFGETLAHGFGHMLSRSELLQYLDPGDPFGSCIVPMTDELGRDLTQLCSDPSCFVGDPYVRKEDFAEDFAEVFRFYLLHGPEFNG